MAQILVRNLDEKIVMKLKTRARKRGRSLQAEARMILEQAAVEEKYTPAEARRLSDKFSRRFKRLPFPDSAELLHEDRDR